MTTHEHEGLPTTADAADVLEQRIPATAEGADAAGLPGGIRSQGAAWEADEGDAVEQRLEVAFDDDREHDEASEPLA